MFKLFCLLSVAFHVIFFVVECFYPELFIRNGSPSQISKSTLLFSFNQGFYNLFLALGLVIGVLRRTKDPSYNVLVKFILIYMLGAAGVLVTSDSALYRGALIQGLPPLLALYFYPKN